MGKSVLYWQTCLQTDSSPTGLNLIIIFDTHWISRPDLGLFLFSATLVDWFSLRIQMVYLHYKQTTSSRLVLAFGSKTCSYNNLLSIYVCSWQSFVPYLVHFSNDPLRAFGLGRCSGPNSTSLPPLDFYPRFHRFPVISKKWVSHKPDKRHPTKSCLSVVVEIKLVTQLLPSGSGPVLQSSSHPAIQSFSPPVHWPSFIGRSSRPKWCQLCKQG